MNPSLGQALDLLRLNNINSCISAVRSYASEKRISGLLDAITRISENYGYLLKYLSEGIEDPGREAMFCNLRDELYALIRNAAIDEESATSTKLFYSTLRSVRYVGMRLEDPLSRFLSADAALQLSDLQDDNGSVSDETSTRMNEKDRALKDIFAVVWTLPVAVRHQLARIVNVASDSDISFTLRAVITSALTLSLLEIYDPCKLNALLDIESHTSDPLLRARALTGIVIALSRYAGSIPCDPRLDVRFETWCDDISNYPRLREVVYSLVRTRGSGRLMSQIRSDLIPEISQFGTGFFDSIKDSEGNINLEDIQENPEWEKLIHESGLDKKLRWLNRMRENGADMMLSVFDKLSSHFFFKDADIWLRPFDSREAIRMGIDREVISIFDSLPANNAFCDTDKYAMMLNLSRLPSPARRMMRDAFMAGREQIDVEYNDLSLHSPNPDFDIETLNYARMLYRFFNYFRLRKEFFNPFDQRIDFSSLPYIGKMLAEEEILHCVGETYYHQGFYEDAIDIYRHLLGKKPAETQLLYQKMGYCYERDSKYVEARDCYMKAIATAEAPDKDLWLMQHLYNMIKMTDKKELRAECLEALLDADKDNLEYLKDWLRISFEEGVYLTPDYPTELFDKRLAKYCYLAADTPEAASFRYEVEWRKGNYSGLSQLLAPRIADIEMYLAASSLGSPTNTGNDDNPDDDHESVMANDLIIAACTHAALGKNAEAVAIIRNILMLKEFDREKMEAMLMERKEQSEAFSTRPLLMTMLVEAACAD